MAYTEEKWKSKDGRLIVSKKYHSVHVMPKDPKIKQKRAPRTGPTTETQEKINERHRQERNMRLIADNFQAGDFFLTFTTETRMTAEELKHAVKNMMDKLRRRCEKMSGEKLKYFRVLENLVGRGRPHAHMLVGRFCTDAEMLDILRKIWPHGHVQLKAFGGQAIDCWQVANYYSKQSKKENGARIDTSRNLVRRAPKKRIIHRETFRDEIKPPKGYHVVKPVSYNSVTHDGYPFQIAIFERDGS